MQNEALREAQCALEESRDRYVDLYEFAPVGYVTLTKDAVIIEGNLTVTTILGVDRRKLIKSRFVKFVTDHDRWTQYFASLLRSADKQICELKLMKGDGLVIEYKAGKYPVEAGGFRTGNPDGYQRYNGSGEN